MKVTNILMGIVICGALADSASAVNPMSWRSKTTGNWNVSSNWQYFDGAVFQDAPVPGGSGADYDYPGADDYVYVYNSHAITITDTSAVCDSFDIAASSTLRVGSSGANGKLVVDGTSDQSHDIAGSLLVGHAGGSRTGILLFTSNDQTVYTSGTGVISGAYAGSKIQIASGLTLTNQMSIVGLLTIEAATGTATLHMDAASEIVADRAGDTVLAASLILSDPSSGARPLFAAIASGSKLKFMRSATLRADFVVAGCGTLECGEDVVIVTTGSLDWQEGTLIVASGGSFNGLGPNTYNVGNCNCN